MTDLTDENAFPFRSVPGLKLLVRYWREQLTSVMIPGVATPLLEALNAAPELEHPVLEPGAIEKHRNLVDFLMTAVTPPALTDQELTAAMAPFQFKAFFTSRAFRERINLSSFDRAKVNMPGHSITKGKILHACLMILNKYYNVNISFDRPLLFTIRDESTDLDRVYKVEIGRQFLEVVALKEPEPIEPTILKFLIEKTYDTDLWLHYLKPENFEFHGFMVFKLVDVTEQEMLSSIKYDLLEKNAVGRKETFAIIQNKLRSIFNLQDLHLGLAFFDANNNIILNSPRDAWRSLSDKDVGTPCDNFSGSIYERSWTEKRNIAIEDLGAYPYRTIVENTLLKNGVRNLMLAPLIDDGETIGMLELASTTPGNLTALSAAKVEHALPLFTAAVKRAKEEMATEVRAIIQEECTSIHPSVQWRFFEAGANLLAKRRRGEKASLEEIVFKEVYPMFGLTDVRNSSLERNNAIQADLDENLEILLQTLGTLSQQKHLPALDELIYRTELRLNKLRKGLASGDESSILEFLKHEVHPLLEHFTADDETANTIEGYKKELDPAYGVVYWRRRAFEESLQLINRNITVCLDEAEITGQNMFPHYFEKYQTDGVEYTLYLGSSLVKDRPFSPFYLGNFRLWQLMVMCSIDQKVGAIRQSLKNPLEITHLILVHDQPLSIRFRPDEKQFDVDGAYDIRYEIVKKRIDKAYIKNTGERLTQPGTIAIVYNQARIAEEYRRYFEFLSFKKLIAPDVEHLELEELPGATGLRAMRIRVLSPEAGAAEATSVLREANEAMLVH